MSHKVAQGCDVNYLIMVIALFFLDWCNSFIIHGCFTIAISVRSWSIRVISTSAQPQDHYCDVIMGMMASQFTSRTIVYSTVYSSLDQRKHQSSPSLAFVRGIHWWPVNSPHKRPVTRKMFPFDDVIMITRQSATAYFVGCTVYMRLKYDMMTFVGTEIKAYIMYLFFTLSLHLDLI